MKQLFNILSLLLLLPACDSFPEGIEETDIPGATFQAKLWEQIDGDDEKPLVIFLPGSSGGYIPIDPLQGLVREGYDVLSLAVFGEEGLPEVMEEIPLEYVGQCVQWARAHLEGEQRGLVLMGVSRGAELALLYGSHFHDVDAIVAYSPNCLVLPEAVVNNDPGKLRSSWTLRGHPLPFAPLPVLPPEPGWVDYGRPFETMLDDPRVLEMAMIPVEQIRCPVLLLSGAADEIWPAARMSNLMTARMRGFGQADTVINKVYRGAGHNILHFDAVPPWHPSLQQSIRTGGMLSKKYRFPFGGTRFRARLAMKESREAALEFLEMIAEKHRDR